MRRRYGGKSTVLSQNLAQNNKEINSFQPQSKLASLSPKRHPLRWGPANQHATPLSGQSTVLSYGSGIILLEK